MYANVIFSVGSESFEFKRVEIKREAYRITSCLMERTKSKTVARGGPLRASSPESSRGAIAGHSISNRGTVNCTSDNVSGRRKL